MTINTTDLLRAVEQAKKFTILKSLQPVLANIWIQSTEFDLQVAATNFDEIYKNKLPQRYGKLFTVTADAMTLQKILKNIKDNTIELDLIDDVLHLTTKKTTYKLHIITTDDYPEAFINSINKDNYIVVIPEVSTDIIKKVGQASAKYETNNLLSTVNYKSKTNTLCATDGNRLFTCKLDTPTIESSLEIMFAINTVNNLLESTYEVGEVTIKNTTYAGDDYERKFVVFTNDTESIYTKSWEGQYPKYEQLIPQHNYNLIDIKSDALSSALKEVELTCNAQTGITKLFFKDNQLSLETSTPDIGTTTTIANTDKYEVDEDKLSKIALNIKYLKDVTKLGKNLNFSLGSQLSAARVDVDNFTCLLMPIQV
jgi:DNA polymerase-3 subunit beta